MLEYSSHQKCRRTKVLVFVVRTDKPYYLRSMVWVGSYELQKGALRYLAINSVIYHDQYQNEGNSYTNDVALVWLKKPLKLSNDVKAVTLPTVDDTFSSSSECWIIGWGYTGTEGK